MNKKSTKKILSLFLVLTFVFSLFGILKAAASTKTFTLINASVSEKSADTTASVSLKDSNVTTKVTFKKVNDYVVYKLTFKNNDSVDYTIKGITDNNSNEYVTYEYDQHKDETVKAGGTKDILVKVIYSKEVTDVEKRDAKDAVKLSFEIQDPNGNAVVADTVINPKTNDNTAVYMIIAVISAIGIAVLLVKNKKSVKALVMIALIAPFAVKAAEASFIIELDSELKLHDKALVTTEIDGKKVKTLVAYEEKVTKPADPEKAGYEFIGWYVGDQEYDFTTPLTDDVVITAKFKKSEYTITFVPGGAQISTESVKVGKGESILVPSPYNRKGYRFTGWYDAPENGNLVVGKNGKYTPEGNITLYAYYIDGAEDTNLVDMDNNYVISVGDIVTYGPEEFTIIGWDGSGDVKLLANKPLGNDGGIKQVSSNPITSKYSESKYWLIYPSSTPSGWLSNSDYEPYVQNYVYGSSGATMDVVSYDNDLAAVDTYSHGGSKISNNGCSFNSYLSSYDSYLRSMFSFDYIKIDIPTYADVTSIDYLYNEESSSKINLDSGYDFWLQTYMYYQKPEIEKDENDPDSFNLYEKVDAGKMAIYSATSKTITGAEYSELKTIRPVITVYTSDITPPWAYSN